MPYDVKVGESVNYTVAEYIATFPNGTRLLYPFTSCLRPVYPNVYPVVLAIGDNPSFIALENGSLYGFSDVGSPTLLQGLQNLTQAQVSSLCETYGSKTVPGGTVDCYAPDYLYFFLYNGRILDGCGSPYPDFNGSIEFYPAVNSTSGQLDLTNITVQQNGASSGYFLCITTSTTTATITEAPVTANTTVTITPPTNGTVTLTQNPPSEIGSSHGNVDTFPTFLLVGLVITTGAACLAVVTLA
ncbi:MAG: hypothetical protein ACRD6W_14915, partial [Nitrososphaerales archaeon]